MAVTPNTKRQPPISTRKPPRNGPILAATPTVDMMTPIAAPRSSPGTMRAMIDEPSTGSAAAPAPCRTRIAIANSMLGDIETTAAPIPNTTSPVMYIRFIPSTSASRPSMALKMPNDSA